MELLNVIMLKEPYKNDNIGIRKAGESICRGFLLLRFWFGGSGGSALMHGSHPVPLAATHHVSDSE